MSGRARVFAGVPVWRTVAAQGDTAFLAGAQMNPLCANLYALSAFANFRLFQRSDCVEM
jgi:hypothetical protein